MPKFSDFKKLGKRKTRMGTNAHVLGKVEYEHEPDKPSDDVVVLEPEREILEGPTHLAHGVEPNLAVDQTEPGIGPPIEHVTPITTTEHEPIPEPVVDDVLEDPAVTLAKILVKALRLFIANQNQSNTLFNMSSKGFHTTLQEPLQELQGAVQGLQGAVQGLLQGAVEQLLGAVEQLQGAVEQLQGAVEAAGGGAVGGAAVTLATILVDALELFIIQSSQSAQSTGGEPLVFESMSETGSN